MINAWTSPLAFQIQNGNAGEWKRVVDTSLANPDDILECGREVTVATASYEVRPRSVVVLLRPRTKKPV